MLCGSSASKASFSKTLLEMSRAERPHSSFKGSFPEGVTPYEYQVAGVQYALLRPRVIIGDDMGLGKTLQAIMVCNQTKAENVLIVCPAGLRFNWVDEWSKFSTSATKDTLQVVATASDFLGVSGANIVFVSYDLAASAKGQKALRARKWDVLIVDEAHYLKNKDTKRSIALLGNPPRSRSAGPSDPISADRYLFLTGTPVSNRPSDFWNLLRFCAPEHFGNWTKYANRYCDAKKVPFGNGFDTTGSSNLGELQTLARGSCMIRRLKTQVLTQLPSKTRKIVALPTPNEIIQELNQLTLTFTTSEKTVALARQKLADAKTAGDSTELQHAVESLRSAESTLFQETSKVRKHIGMAKVDLAISHITDALSQTGSKIIVGAHHADVIEALVSGLSAFNPVVVTGQVAMGLRHERVRIFQNDQRCRVFIGNIIAAGTGLTLTAAPHVVIVEPDWVPANNAQFEDRAHRIGQAKPVLIEYLAMEQTIDIQILRGLAKKMDVIEQTLDHASSVELDPNTINYGPKGPASPNKSLAEMRAEDKELQEKKMRTIAFGKSLSPRELMAAHSCVKQVAIFDGDHAQAKNDEGFSKMDSEYGNRLARTKLQDLTDFQKGRLAVIAWRYRRQCKEVLVQLLKKPTK